MRIASWIDRWRTNRVALVAGAVSFIATSCTNAGEPAGASPAPAAGAVAVVELFTSEGCSSCPSADASLVAIAADATRGGLPVYAMEFHVDYWDGLGWPDRFSSPAATDRQRRYAAALGSDTYTPQMVVNGEVEFNGSSRAAARRAIDAALAKPSPAHLTIQPPTFAGRTATIDYKTDAPAGSVVTLIALEPSATTDVRRGENAGRTLKHANVVRALTATPLAKSEGKAQVELPANLDPKTAKFVVMVQDQKKLHVLAAAESHGA